MTPNRPLLLLVALGTLATTQGSTSLPPLNGTTSSPYHLLHSQSIHNPLFTLNPSLFHNLSLITVPRLSFAYWTDSPLGLFLAKHPPNTNKVVLRLNQSSSWENATIANLTLEQLNNLHFESADEEVTLALKDVQIKLTDKVEASKMTPNPITGYKGVNQTSNLQTVAAYSSILAISGKSALLTVKSAGKFNFAKESLQFELSIIPSGTTQQVTLSLNQTGCLVNATQADGKTEGLAEASISCKIEVNASKITTLSSFTLTLTTGEAFILVPRLLPGVTLTTTSPPFGQLYALAPNVTSPDGAYLNLIDSQSPDGSSDNCYTLVQSNPHGALGVYLTFPKAPSGVHLTSITSSSHTFCLNDYLALRSLANFQLTISLTSPSPSPSFLHISRYPTNSTLTPPSPHYSRVTPFTSGWHFSSHVFDYTITGPQHLGGFTGFTGTLARFSACDIVGNCYPYRPTQDHWQPGKWHYNLDEAYLRQLQLSPYLRIACDKGPVNDEMYSFVYDRFPSLPILTSFIASFHTHNPNIPNFSTAYTSSSHFLPLSPPRSPNYTLHLPLDTLDLRVYHLSLLISSTSHIMHPNSSAHFTLRKLSFTSASKPNVEYDLSHLHTYTDPKTQTINISTSSFFHVEPFETSTSFPSGYLTLVLDIQPETGKTRLGMGLDFTLAPVSKPKFASLPVSLPPNPHYRILAPLLDPRLLLSSGLTHSGPGRTLPPTTVHLNFTLLRGQSLAAGDIQINQILHSQGRTRVIDKSGLLKISGNTASFVDEEAENATNRLDGSLFELLYEIVLVNTQKQVEIGLVAFNLSKNAVKGKTPKGPIIMGTNSQIDPVECPVGFTLGEDGACHLSTVTRHQTLTCNQDCSNLFSVPFLKSSEYSNSTSQQ